MGTLRAVSQASGGGASVSFPILASQGGTGANSSASTGIAHVAGGTWTFSAVVEADLSLSDNTTANVSTSAHGFAPKAPNDSSKFLDGTGAYSTPAGSAALSGISAATGANTIASGNNTGQVWNWANTSNTTVAFTFGETSAATNGTSTSGVPNQVLLKLTTLASSTQSPLSVYSRAAHVFSVSPTAAQLLGTTGTNTNPTYGFAASSSTGMYGGTSVRFSVQGTLSAIVSGDFGGGVQSITGAANNMSFSSMSDSGTGMFFASSAIGFSSANTEIARFTGGTNTALFKMIAMAFANLGTPADGSFAYCSDCDAPTLVDSTCTSAGAKTGSFAARVNGAWKCFT